LRRADAATSTDALASVLRCLYRLGRDAAAALPELLALAPRFPGLTELVADAAEHLGADAEVVAALWAGTPPEAVGDPFAPLRVRLRRDPHDAEARREYLASLGDHEGEL